MDFDTFLYRYKRLRKLVVEDEDYLYYVECAELCKKKLLRLRKKRSVEFKKMLGYYEDCMRIIGDRITEIACMHMEFPDEENDRSK